MLVVPGSDLIAPLKCAVAATALCLFASAPALAASDTPQEVRLTAAQARVLAYQALATKPALAIQLAEGLLAKNPKDGEAHFILARAFQRIKRPGQGRKHARLAYDLAGNTAGKFQSSQLAARLAVEDKRPSFAQLWLRRSLLHLPDDRLRDQVIKDYRVLRRLSPWSFGVKASLAPTDNLNNGAVTDLMAMEGFPLVGILSPSAQALSGLRATADLSLSYRLSETERQQSYATFRYFGQRVSLSDEARAFAPDVEDRDLRFDYAEAGLTQNRRLGPGTFSYGAVYGQSWSGGEGYQTTRRISTSYGLATGERGHLRVTAQGENTTHDTGLPEVNTRQLIAQYSHNTENWGRLGASVSVRADESRNFNARRKRVDGSLTWSPQKPLGPVTPAFGISAGWQDYPDYQVGFFAVPGGRQDHSLSAHVDFTFQTLDYGGFVPSVRVQARRTDSNVTRFETRETTVSWGIKSSF